MALARLPLFFLLPIALYLFCWQSNFAVADWLPVFYGLQAIGLAAAGYVAWIYRSCLSRADLAFWGGAIALFVVGGAGLEFPSDPWEHFDRIVTWNELDRFGNHATRQRFIYFWNWTWVRLFSPSWRHCAADLLSALWQTVMWLSAYSLLRRLGFSSGIARLQVLAGILFFGTSIFSFRYYALAGTPLAFALYFAGLVCALDGWEKSRRYWLWLPLLFGGILLNHPQEAVFLTLGTAAVSAVYVLRERREWRRWLAGGFLAATLVVMVNPEGVGMLLGVLHPVREVGWATWFSLFDLQGRPFLTYGLPGLVGFGFAQTLWRSHPVFAVLSTMPLALLLWPPSALALAAVNGEDSDVYRVLYAFPIAFAFALAVERGVHRCFAAPSLRWAAVGIAALSLPFFAPWYGRGIAQVYRAPAFLELGWVTPVEAELVGKGSRRDPCRLETDPVTQFALEPWLRGFDFQKERHSRLNPRPLLYELRDARSLSAFIDDRKVCAVLVADPQRLPPIPWSRMGKYSGHWAPHHVAVALTPPRDLLPLLENLSQRGWRKSFIAPFYVLWMRPNG